MGINNTHQSGVIRKLFQLSIFFKMLNYSSNLNEPTPSGEAVNVHFVRGAE